MARSRSDCLLVAGVGNPAPSVMWVAHAVQRTAVTLEETVRC